MTSHSLSDSRSHSGPRRRPQLLCPLRPHALVLAGASLAAWLAVEAQAQTQGSEAVIVTGTRAVGTKATQSVSPIAVIGSDSLEKTGQASVIDALLRLEPTFQTQAKGGDLANMVRSAALRGLSANQTLVLINGKRRNTTAYISTGGYTSGAAAVDLDFIPVSSVERVEVLKDGAAAQYGSDAIAGVLNIILKTSTSGSAEIGYGRFADSKINPNTLGNGRTRTVALDKGFALGDAGFIHLSAELRDHLHTNQTGPELRTQNTNVALNGGPVDAYVPNTLGDPAYTLGSTSFNAGFSPTPEIDIYSFGTFAKRNADSWQNNRPNEKAVASTCFYPPGSATVIRTNKPGGAALGTACTSIAVGDLAKAYYPGGYFTPSETLKETNTALAAGIKGSMLDDARWDLSVGYGADKMDIGVENSLNYAYLLRPVTANALGPNGTSPTSAYIGQYNNSQFLVNLDLSKPYSIGLPAPLDVAIGVEARRDTYEIKQGDVVSWSNGGLQGFIGMTPQDAGSHARTEKGAYLDLSTNFSQNWIVGAAARHERFSDAGSTSTGKLSSRYDFNSALALRGTVSTGFRSPTLAEQYFTTTTVGPTTATVFLPAGSQAAALVGGRALKPETAKNLSLGLVITPTRDTRFTMDAYYIKIVDRILLASGISAGGAAPLGGAGGLVRQAIALRGVVLPPTSTDAGTSVAFFSNGVDLKTTGVDLTAATDSNLGAMGKINWNLAANFKNTKILRSDAVFTPAVLWGLTDTPPKHKIVGSADWTSGAWSTTLRISHYGEASSLSVPTGATYPAYPYVKTVVKQAFIGDVELGYQPTLATRFVVGVNNFTNRRPELAPDVLVAGDPNVTNSRVNSTGAGTYPTFSPYGINGAYYYLKAAYKF